MGDSGSGFHCGRGGGGRGLGSCNNETVVLLALAIGHSEGGVR